MGGKSSRMHQCKAELMVNDETFYQKIAHSMEKFGKVYLSVASKENHYDDFPLIIDEIKDCGPIGGIYSALNQVAEDYVFFCPCDCPTFTEKYFKNMLDAFTDDLDGLILSDDSGLTPTIGIYSKKLLPALTKQIVSKNYRLRVALNECNVKTYYSDHLIENINTPTDYAKFINNIKNNL